MISIVQATLLDGRFGRVGRALAECEYILDGRHSSILFEIFVFCSHVCNHDDLTRVVFSCSFVAARRLYYWDFNFFCAFPNIILLRFFFFSFDNDY